MRQYRLRPHSHLRPVAPMAIPMMVNALWWIPVVDRQHRWTATACSTSVITVTLAAMRWRPTSWRRPQILVSFLNIQRKLFKRPSHKHYKLPSNTICLYSPFLLPFCLIFLHNSSNCPRITALTPLALEFPLPLSPLKVHAQQPNASLFTILPPQPTSPTSPHCTSRSRAFN